MTMELAVYIVGALIILLAVFWILLWSATYHPKDLQDEPVTDAKDAPLIKPGHTLKVLNWNVQYMAGKNYVFWYDLNDRSGPDARPSSEDIADTLSEVARVIKDEAPDIILLQEIDDGAKRTDYGDQLKQLLRLLPSAYACHASTFYWKASFVPHPRIMGAVGMKLSILSKYRISAARRHRLTPLPNNPVTRQFHLKRAVLETRLTLTNGDKLAVLNTHLESFGQGTNVLQRQIADILSLLTELTREGVPWIIGGDFNLLPSQTGYHRLMDAEKRSYHSKTEIAAIYQRYRGIPSLEAADGPEYKKWFTYFSNKPSVTNPDRTIDYIFIANNIQLGRHYVRQKDTSHISDHFPMIATVQIP